MFPLNTPPIAGELFELFYKKRIEMGLGQKQNGGQCCCCTLVNMCWRSSRPNARERGEEKKRKERNGLLIHGKLFLAYNV